MLGMTHSQASDAVPVAASTHALALTFAHSGLVSGHERLGQQRLAERIAALLGIPFGGVHVSAGGYPFPVYFVPNETLLAADAARLGIRGELDLFGGVAPAAFVASKAITHALVGERAAAPAGWSHEFSRRVERVVPRGYTAFSEDDAERAGRLLLRHGSVRIKPARERGGMGQTVASNAAGLSDAIAACAQAAAGGIVLEETLSGERTFSVGQVRVPGMTISYYGLQRLTENNAGRSAYGGTDIIATRGDFRALLALEMDEAARLAVRQAAHYDAAAMEWYPGLFASRRNYDVIQGRDAAGTLRSGVLEQSWRIGGASGAEVVALEALRDPAIGVVQASSVETYGGREPAPPDAVLLYRGDDAEVGEILKYALVRKRWPSANR
jgi:hypothetical protein